MSRRDNNLAFFLVFFGLTLAIALLGKLGVLSGVSDAASNASWKISSKFNFGKIPSSELDKLSQQNADLRKKLLDNQNLLSENKALRDQFATTSFPSVNLIPAKVVGSPGFIPGITNPDYLVIDKGENDGLKEGDAVIYQNNFVGKVVGLSENFSKVQIAININSFTAKVLGEKELLGVVRGKGNILILDNILLSENLKKDQLVVTKGDFDLPAGRQGEGGLGIPPDLVIGKIVSIEKKSSELFQRAEVQSFLDFKNLSTVFVVK